MEEQFEIPIYIKKGSARGITVNFFDKFGNIIDLTGYTAILQVRRTFDSKGVADIELSTENGGITLNGTDGNVTLNFIPSNTLLLEACYNGEWDLFIIPPGGYAEAIIGGDFIVLGSSTKDF